MSIGIRNIGILLIVVALSCVAFYSCSMEAEKSAQRRTQEPPIAQIPSAGTPARRAFDTLVNFYSYPELCNAPRQSLSEVERIHERALELGLDTKIVGMPRAISTRANEQVLRFKANTDLISGACKLMNDSIREMVQP
jgi:hypothetical protein